MELYYQITSSLSEEETFSNHEMVCIIHSYALWHLPHLARTPTYFLCLPSCLALSLLPVVASLATLPEPKPS